MNRQRQVGRGGSWLALAAGAAAMVAGCTTPAKSDHEYARAAEEVLKGKAAPANSTQSPGMTGLAATTLSEKPAPAKTASAPSEKPALSYGSRSSATVPTTPIAPTPAPSAEPKATEPSPPAAANPQSARSLPAAAGNPQSSVEPPSPPGEGEVSLTLADVVHRALANNHDIQVAGYGPPQARQDIIGAEAVFDPSIFATNTVGRVDRPVQSTLDTGTTEESKLIQNTWSWQGGLKTKIPTGGSFAVYESWDYMNTNSVFSVPNPQYASRLTFEFAQPLLRGAGVEYNRAAIRVANLNEAVAVQDFRKAVTDSVATVINTYWQLSFDRESVRVSRASFDLAADVLRREKARQERGVSSEVDLNRAAAAVALRQAALIQAENQARDTMDRLKLLMNAPDLPLSGERLVIPTETPRFYLVNVNRSEALMTALAHRPELERARNAVAVNRIRTDVAKADRLPKLDATLRYVMNGLDQEWHASIDEQSFTRLITWSAMIEFEYPLGNRAADSLHRKRILEYEQSLADLERLSSQALQEVNSAVRAVVQSRQEVESTLEGQTAAALTVRGEQLRFERGQNTTDDILRAQETLSTAQRDHLRALLNFNLGLLSLQRAEGVLLESQGIEVFQPEGTPEHPRPLGLRAAPGKAGLPAGVTVAPASPSNVAGSAPRNK